MAAKVNALGVLTAAVLELVIQTGRLKEAGASVEEFARHFVRVREFYESLGDINKVVDELKNRLAYETIPEAFEAQGLSTITLKEGYRITVQGLVRASSRDMVKCIEWMDTHKIGEKGIEECPKEDENSLATLAKRTINASTLAAFAKDLMATKAAELPGDLFNVVFGSNTSITKVK